MKRTGIIIGVLIAVLGLTWLGYATVGRRSERNGGDDLETVTVERGNIAAIVNATGRVEPRAQVSLGFKVSGQLIELPVKEGDRVETGQALARLDTVELDLQAVQAEAGLRSAQAQLNQLQSPPNEDDLAAAQAAWESAQAAYDKVQAGPTEAEIASARAAYDAGVASYESLQAGPSLADLASAKATLEKAAAALQQAQAAYDQVATRPNAAMLPQALQLQQATIDYQAAKAAFDQVAAGATEEQLKSALAQREQARAQWETLLQSPSPSDLKAAEQQLAQAQAQLDKLRRGADENDLITAQSQVDQAQASLDQARAQLDGATLRAPFSGVVASIGAELYGQISPVTPVIILVDDSEFHLTVSVDEVDVGQVQAGNAVSTTLDSFRGAAVTGRITSVSAVPNIESGVVSYPVTIAFDPTDIPLRVGMTANASITAEQHEAVLIVPNRTIQIDRETGQLFVERVENDIPQRVEISTGLRNETMSEVVSGLEEGDTLAIRSLSRIEQTRQRLSGD